MQVKIMFPTTKEIADIMAINCAASMRSTRTKEPAHELQMLICTTKYGANGCAKDCTYSHKCVERMLIQAKEMKHWSIFEHFFATVSVSEVSRALTHQLVRHRLFSYSQQSQRCVDPTKDLSWYVVPPTIQENGERLIAFERVMRASSEIYQYLTMHSVPDEDARYVLPNACYTHIVISGNARNWLHFFKMRLDSHAQWEIRDMAQEILRQFKELAPIIFEGAGELDV